MDLDRLNSIKATFALAEHRCKIVETRTGSFLEEELQTGLLIPSVNQLRYAGYHILKYVTTESMADLDEAEAHCKRAVFDAYQVELIFYLKQFKAFQDEFTDLIISETVPNYWEWQEQHEAAHTVIREYGETPDRDKYYGFLVPHIDNLNRVHTMLPCAREDLQKKRKAIARGRIGKGAAALVAVVGLLVAGGTWIAPDYFKQSAQTLIQPASAKKP